MIKQVRRTIDDVLLIGEAARAERHQTTPYEQLKNPGEKAKIVAVTRCLPGKLLDIVYAGKVRDSIPVNGKLSIKPQSYGAETIVYIIEDEQGRESHAVKIFTGKYSPEQQLANVQRSQALLHQFMPEHVEPTHYFFSRHPFNASRRALIGIQKFIEGKDFFQNPHLAEENQQGSLASGVDTMLERTGLVPDILGYGNVIVGQLGELRIVDTSSVIAPRGNENEQAIHQRLQTLQTRCP